MSRSFKKNPVSADNQRGGARFAKRRANKKVRRFDGEIAKGKEYKKLFDTYEIHDYISRRTWEETKADYANNDYLIKRYPTLKDFYRVWRKIYKNK